MATMNKRQRLSLFDVMIGFAVGAIVFSMPDPLKFYGTAAWLSFLLAMYNRRKLIAWMGRLPLIGYRRKRRGKGKGASAATRRV